MSAYAVIIAPRAIKQINSLPQKIKDKIGDTIYNVIAPNPLIGKPLKADLKGIYSYRLGDYRILYSITKNKLIIHVIKIMHRREAYR